MKLTTLGKLRSFPDGTIYCELEDGHSDGLARKGGIHPHGFWHMNLIPEPSTMKIGWYLESNTLRQVDEDEEDSPVLVFDQYDVERLIEKLKGDPA